MPIVFDYPLSRLHNKCLYFARKTLRQSLCSSKLHNNCCRMVLMGHTSRSLWGNVSLLVHLRKCCNETKQNFLIMSNVQYWWPYNNKPLQNRAGGWEPISFNNHVVSAKYTPRVRFQLVSEHEYPCSTRISCKHKPESKPLQYCLRIMYISDHT